MMTAVSNTEGRILVENCSFDQDRANTISTNQVIEIRLIGVATGISIYRCLRRKINLALLRFPIPKALIDIATGMSIGPGAGFPCFWEAIKAIALVHDLGKFRRVANGLTPWRPEVASR